MLAETLTIHRGATRRQVGGERGKEKPVFEGGNFFWEEAETLSFEVHLRYG